MTGNRTTRAMGEAWRTLERAADAACARGALLFRLDLATEIARAALGSFGPREGVLLAAFSSGRLTVALVEEGVAAKVRASVRFGADGRAIVRERTAPAGLELEAMAAARRTAGAMVADEHHRARTVLVLPPERRAAELDAYVIAIGRDADDVTLGPHWWLRLQSDGRAMLARERLSHTSLALHAPADLRVTHFGAAPSEIHAYLSLKHDLALEVLTLESGIRWRIEGGRVAALGTVRTAEPHPSSTVDFAIGDKVGHGADRVDGSAADDR